MSSYQIARARRSSPAARARPHIAGVEIICTASQAHARMRGGDDFFTDSPQPGNGRCGALAVLRRRHVTERHNIERTNRLTCTARRSGALTSPVIQIGLFCTSTTPRLGVRLIGCCRVSAALRLLSVASIRRDGGAADDLPPGTAKGAGRRLRASRMGHVCGNRYRAGLAGRS
jgi:hypothetical protein